jgi:sugar (pentulose or hexulose) kinase
LLPPRRERQTRGGVEQASKCRFETTKDGGATLDPETLAEAVFQTMDATLARVRDAGLEVSAVATSTFWHSVLGVDRQGRPTIPPSIGPLSRAGRALQHSGVRRDHGQDALVKPVTVSGEAEASTRGAALVTIEAMGGPKLEEFGAFPGETYEPAPSHHEAYGAALNHQKRLYDAVVSGSWNE